MTTRFYPGMTTVQVAVEEPMPVQEDETRAVVHQGATDIVSSGGWGWEQLRDYVYRMSDERWGAQPRDVLKDSGIFKGFVKRWGDKAEPIARHAFETCSGVWRGAPVRTGRFTQGSDPYFAAVIAKNLS